MLTPLEALLLVTALACAAFVIGLVWRDRQGRLVAVTAPAAARGSEDAAASGAPLGSTATLVQFSSRTCSTCPAASRSLDAIAADFPGVTHREIDLTDDPAPAERYRVRQVPTTLVLDRHGRVLRRIGGMPRAAELRSFLAQLSGPDAGQGPTGGEAYGAR